MAQTLNQFAMTPEVGDLDLQFPGQVLTAQVDASSTSIVPGQPVKIVDSAGGLPKVTALTANTDKTFGFAIRNLKDAQIDAGEPIEIAFFGAVMYMTAGAAIARGANVEVVYTTNKVITSGGTNPIVGKALDKAAANNDVIRVFIPAPVV